MTLPPDTAWLRDPEAQRVCRVLTDAGHRVLFVGGCVRNALMGLPDSDVDLCTDARPERVMALAAEAGMRPVATGLDHGTVTVIAGGSPFEITTFRRDVATDGRRAVVAFSTDIAEDARRRDFTFNALYARPDGTLVDPLGGLADLRARRVRFIEDAETRIREDYLRILRFFRFSAHYAAEQAFEADTLDAIARTASGIDSLSAERIGQEMIRLLGAKDPAPALGTMAITGVLGRVLPGADPAWISPITAFEDQLGRAPDWRVRLAALGGADVQDRLRLSKADVKVHIALRNGMASSLSLEAIAYRQSADIARGVMLLRGAMNGAAPQPTQDRSIAAAARARFPVTAADLMPQLEGAALGARLRHLEDLWIASGFAHDRETLLGLP